MGKRFSNFAVDSYSYANNTISGPKFVLNSGATSWGLAVGAAGIGIPSFIGGVMYFTIDTFYPGGIKGAMQMNKNFNRTEPASIRA